MLHRNWDLHVTSSCHRISIYSINKSKPLTARRLKEIEQHGQTLIPITRPLTIDLETEEHYEEEMKKYGNREPEE